MYRSSVGVKAKSRILTGTLRVWCGSTCGAEEDGDDGWCWTSVVETEVEVETVDVEAEEPSEERVVAEVS